MGKPQPVQNSRTLASDAERERAAERVRHAAVEGRLSLEEFDQRLSEVYLARTHSELDTAVRGLPEPSPADSLVVSQEPTSRGALGMFGWFSRRGRWVAPGRFTAVSMFGGGELDLRDARFAEREVRIRAIALWGGTEIVVPDDIEVEVRGYGLFGGFDRRAAQVRPGAPRVVISGLAMFGAVVTKSRRREG
ncbi:DUF1707 SHOCT-like domain-containing protein [Spirillospora sp. CA-294931]|uniref:DUF1707 SHOCT-like domain-containing protein n=1 Tax=Spirillospora sp. CA-294931 TaxID=3240042 RepID=UPI003D911105